MGIEIERKYLIRKPDMTMLDELATETWEVTQVYLLTETLCTERVRRVREESGTRYFHTLKRRLSALSCVENEEEITAEAYESYLLRRDPERRAVEKTRWRIPYEAHLLEIDVYPFWQDRAILEIELEDENEPAAIPSYTAVIREVTDDPSYRNHGIAKAIAEQATDRLLL